MRHGMITGALLGLALVTAAVVSVAIGGGGTGAASSTSSHMLSGGSAAAPFSVETTLAALAETVQAQQSLKLGAASGPGAQPGDTQMSGEDRRKAMQLELFRLGSEIAQLAAEFGQ